MNRRSLFARVAALSLALLGSAFASAAAQGAVPPPPKRMHGMCFGPFRAGEAPGMRAPLPSTVAADVATAGRLAERLRTYGMSGGGWQVPELCEEQGLVCLPGAWLGRDRAANDRECELLIRTARRHAKSVETVFVGNEVLLRSDLSPERLIARIQQVRAEVSVPVTTAEPWKVWLKHPELMAAVDVVTVHIYPYWDEIPLERATAHTLAKFAAVKAAAGDKPVMLGEFGWPSAGQARGGAVPSLAAQQRYLDELVPELEKREVAYFLFEMWDEAWKAGDEGTVGPHWGLFHSDGRPKFERVGGYPLLPASSERPPRETGPLPVKAPPKKQER